MQLKCKEMCVHVHFKTLFFVDYLTSSDAMTKFRDGEGGRSKSRPQKHTHTCIVADKKHNIRTGEFL